MITQNTHNRLVLYSLQLSYCLAISSEGGGSNVGGGVKWEWNEEWAQEGGNLIWKMESYDMTRPFVLTELYRLCSP